jgi:hypothetical protein
LVLAVACVAAGLTLRSEVRAESNVLLYRAEPFQDDATVRPEVAKAAAEIVAKRCRHAGLDVVGVDAENDRIRIRGGLGLRVCEAAVSRLAERVGLVEFRVRADTIVEDAARDARLQADEAPPEGFEWRLPETGELQVLVETPERAAAAGLEALRKKRAAEGAVKAAEEALAKVLAEQVFTNEHIAATSVQRSIKSHGAARFLRVAVRFEFKDDRKAAFEKFTGEHVGRELAVVIDGKVHVMPKIAAALPGMGELVGPGTGYTDEQAQELAAIFASGPLPCRLVAVK